MAVAGSFVTRSACSTTIVMTFETFEHTADLGLRIRAADLPTLFVDAARGLFALIVVNVNTVRAAEPFTILLAAESTDLLLFDWLSELLVAYETRHLLFSRFEVDLNDDGLRATAWGEPLDRARHVLDHEVKAITYHGLKVERAGNAWLAEVIVDI